MHKSCQILDLFLFKKTSTLTFSGSKQEHVGTTMLPAQLKTCSDLAEVGGIPSIFFASGTRQRKWVSCTLQNFKGSSSWDRRDILKYCCSSFPSSDKETGCSVSSLSNSSQSKDCFSFFVSESLHYCQIFLLMDWSFLWPFLQL